MDFEAICPWLRLSHPPLTTIHQPIHEKAEFAARLLLDILANHSDYGQRLFSTHLVERGTIAPAAS